MDPVKPPNKKILVVDDDPLHREMMQSLIGQKSGLDVIMATNSAEAFKALREYGPAIALVLCDLNMPDTDGVEFMGGLATQAYRGPIIIISGANPSILTAATLLGRANKLDIVGALPKPVKYGVLLELIASANARSPLSMDPDTAKPS